MHDGAQSCIDTGCLWLSAVFNMKTVNCLYYVFAFIVEIFQFGITRRNTDSPSHYGATITSSERSQTLYLAFRVFVRLDSKSICFLLGASLTTCKCSESRCSCTFRWLSRRAAAAISFLSRHSRAGASLLRCCHFCNTSKNCFFPTLVLLPAGCTRNSISISSSGCWEGRRLEVQTLKARIVRFEVSSAAGSQQDCGRICAQHLIGYAVAVGLLFFLNKYKLSAARRSLPRYCF